MKRRLYSTLLISITLLTSVALISACDFLGGSEGVVQVLLTDAPIDSAKQANVTIERVELVGDAGVVVVNKEAREFDLLTLQNGITAELAEEEVPAGRYEQIRLVINEEATLVFNDGSESSFFIPSGAETGVKLDFPDGFVVGQNAEKAVVVLDFDASQSFVEAGATGTQVFKPVVQVESVGVEGAQDNTAG